MSTDVWYDPRTWVAIIGVIIGVYGFFWGNPWNRRESRLDALSKILQPMWRTAQHLHDANDSRSKAEQLKLSFPEGEKTPEAVQRVNSFILEYGEHIKAAFDEHRVAEAEFASKYFRFPDKINRLVQAARESLSEFGVFVNGGMFEKADLQFVKFRDDYHQVTEEGRGWRLADPL